MSHALSIVGILNLTPDSYFDGGQFNQLEAAVSRCGELLQQGADIIDIGGESSGPGSPDVSEAEERERTIAVIKAIKQAYPDASLAIDTYKAAIAQEAIEAGASMVNDVTAGRGDVSMFKVIADAAVPYVMMYSKDNSARTTIDELQYDDVVGTLITFFDQQLALAEAAGVQREQIILDPGMGHFISSDPQYSFEVIRRLPELIDHFGLPLYLSPSRKSFLAGPGNLPPKDRLPGTIAASAVAALNGASYIRTHDVLEVKRGCDVAMQSKR